MTAVLRLHPLAAISGMRRYVILLLIPLIRGLTAIGDGWMEWLSGAWIDLLALAAILLLGILRWRSSRVFLSDGQLIYERGLFWHTRDVFFAATVSTVRVSVPWYLRPLRIQLVRLDTRTPPLLTAPSLMLHADDLRTLERLFLRTRGDRIQTVVRPRPAAVAATAAATSSLVGGLTFTAALLSNTVRYARETTADQILTTAFLFLRKVSLGLPPAVSITAATLLLAYLAAFLSNLSAYYRFTASRSPRALHVSGGLFTRSCFQTPVRQIESVDLRYGLISRRFAGVSAYVNAAGLSDGTFAPAIIPTGRLHETMRQLRRLLPELGSFACPIRVQPRCAWRSYLLIPLVGLLLLAAGSAVSSLLLPDMAGLIAFWAAMLGAAIVWMGLHRLHAMRHSGVGVEADALCLRYGRGFHFHRVRIAKRTIGSLRISQNRWQAAHDLCTLHVSEMSRRRRLHRVRSVPYKALLLALKKYGYR